MENIIMVEPDKFLLDYKILIFAIAIIILCLVVALKNKSIAKNIWLLLVSVFFTTVGYIFIRMRLCRNFGYMFLLETNSDFMPLITFGICTLIIFLMLFFVDKLIHKIRGGK